MAGFQVPCTEVLRPGLRCTIFINDLFYYKTEAKLSNEARDNQLYFAVTDAAVVETRSQRIGGGERVAGGGGGGL